MVKHKVVSAGEGEDRGDHGTGGITDPGWVGGRGGISL